MLPSPSTCGNLSYTGQISFTPGTLPLLYWLSSLLLWKYPFLKMPYFFLSKKFLRLQWFCGVFLFWNCLYKATFISMDLIPVVHFPVGSYRGNFCDKLKCLSTLCHFAVNTFTLQLRQTQVYFTVVKKNYSFHLPFSAMFLWAETHSVQLRSTP